MEDELAELRAALERLPLTPDDRKMVLACAETLLAVNRGDTCPLCHKPPTLCGHVR